MLSGTIPLQAITGDQLAPSKNSRGTSMDSREYTLMKDSRPMMSRPCRPAGSEAERDAEDGRG
eukprot:4096892-Pyramimonas_sp.AAC.1